MKKKNRTLTLAPFCYSKPSVDDTAKVSLFLFIPQLVMLFLTESYNSLILVLIAELAAVTAFYIDSCIRKERFKLELTVLFQGLLIGLFIPSDYPFAAAFVIVTVILLLSEYVMGGYSNSWINPAVVTILALFFFRSSLFPKFLIPVEYLKQPDIFSNLIYDGTFSVMPLDKTITGFLNRSILKFTGLVLPEGYVTLLWDNGSMIAGFRFNLLTVFSTLILISFDLIDWIVPTVFLAVYLFAVRVFGLVPYGSMLNQGDILLAACTSGTLIGAFFLLPWAGTVPMSIYGKIIYAVGAGIAAFLINGCGTGHIGIMFTVLAVNIVSPLIMYIEDWFYLTFYVKKQEL